MICFGVVAIFSQLPSKWRTSTIHSEQRCGVPGVSGGLARRHAAPALSHGTDNAPRAIPVTAGATAHRLKRATMGAVSVCAATGWMSLSLLGRLLVFVY